MAYEQAAGVSADYGVGGEFNAFGEYASAVDDAAGSVDYGQYAAGVDVGTEVQEPPMKRFKGAFAGKGVGKGKSTGTPGECGEVRFDNVESAQRAYQVLDNSVLMGVQIRIVPDTHSQDGTKVLVYNMPPGIGWQELKDHFSQVGTVCFASIARKGLGKGYTPPPRPAAAAAPGGSCVGEVRFATAEEAIEAITQLNGATFQDKVIAVDTDRSAADGTKLLVYNLPAGTQWQELKDYFLQVGKVVFAGIAGQRLGAAGLQGAGGFGGGCKGGPARYFGPRPSGPAGGGAGATAAGEVRFDSATTAEQAVQALDGSIFHGQQIKVVQDATSKDGSRLIVSNLPGGTSWQDLKDHFALVGPVAYAGVTNALPPQMMAQTLGPSTTYVPPGKGKGGGGYTPPVQTGFDFAQHAQLAYSTLDGSVMRGSKITVQPNVSSQDGSKLHVFNLPPNCAWQELKDYFQQCGQVAFAAVHSGAQPGKGMMPRANAAAALAASLTAAASLQQEAQALQAAQMLHEA
eukprot:CAMPEP_0168421054 /NCGR_PEP_ID=MMETSP0228-20121227/33085_1 /TAXON_ID=133427 /ORGANISM="Protoceratium reticulatum, Strain CCCM 535 (=CCMP 1889)" /LENGTH=515 /DNA_ID=CAMNT_0008434953 /DNA_START=22 /DNA_END=1565 /DNA_ORIENTATION=-